MENKALLEAVNKAIEALKEVKRELMLASPEWTAASRPDFAPQPEETGKKPEEALVIRTASRMEEAARLASESCSRWKYQNKADNTVDADKLMYICREWDAARQAEGPKRDSWYCCTADGAIGFTENGGKSLVWLFLPLGREMSSLPKTLEADSPAAGMQGAPLGAFPGAGTGAAPQPAGREKLCPVCGKPYTEGSKFCMGCGSSLEPFEAVAPAPTSAPAERVCPVCGKPYTAGSKFCMGCGTPIREKAFEAAPAADERSFCLKCGAPLLPGDKFCMKCGTRV
ncbi:MAG: zinc ribbon domain-containing protein [Lachnospiraceae bacterium]|nr:zinc ribbon domain-containing protein [Lachnospiraceae bacterium]